MPIPGFQSFLLPILKALSNGETISFNDLTIKMVQEFGITDDEKKQMIPSGRYPVYRSRIGWAKTYLKKACLIEDPSRGMMKITDRGKELLKKNHAAINIKILSQYQEFNEFRARKDKAIILPDDNKAEVIDEAEKTPEELIESGYELINEDLRGELLERIIQKPFDFFEYLVGALLEKIGYGKPTITGKSGDNGIDGFVDQDALGLEKIYFQAKRFGEKTNVTAAMLRDFIGSLHIEKASKGVFITTSKFPKDSDIVIAKGTKSIVLIDGERLVDLMIKYGVGTYTDKTYEIKKIDLDFFELE